MKRTRIALTLVATALLLAACGTKKTAIDGTGQQQTGTAGQTATTGTPTPADPSSKTATYLKTVADNGVTARNVVGSMTFNIKMGSKDITVPGSVHMRRDEVIRLQLFIPLLGSEVGRIEFSPNRVLIVDRMHKEYIEADYTQLDFLKNNGLNFYSLQALFWNQLLVPGQKAVTAKDFSRFTLEQTTQNSQGVRLVNGNMTYNWTTTPKTGQIVMVNVSYATARSGASSLLWTYADFKPLGAKLFPAHQDFQFSTTASKEMKTVKVSIDMDEVKDKSDWDAVTTVSAKYKKVEATDVLGKLLQF